MELEQEDWVVSRARKLIFVKTDKGAVGVAAGAFAAIILVSVMAAITLLQGPI